MKILKNKYGITSNHLLVNKVSTQGQYQRIVKTLSETVENFLQTRIQVLGGVSKENLAVDQFDNLLLSRQKSPLHNNFIKILKKFS